MENESPYGLQINKKPIFQIIPIVFLEAWGSVLRNVERQLIEFLLTEAKVVSKAVVDKCEVKSREIFQENFRATRNKVKNKSKG